MLVLPAFCSEAMPFVGELRPVDLTDFGAGVSKAALRLFRVLAGVFGVISSNLLQ